MVGHMLQVPAENDQVTKDLWQGHAGNLYCEDPLDEFFTIHEQIILALSGQQSGSEELCGHLRWILKYHPAIKTHS